MLKIGNNNSTQFYKKRKVLITGGLGFIGSNLAIELSKAGAKVSIIDAHILDTGWNLFNINQIKKDVECLRLNIHSPKVIPLIKSSEYIFNLAGVLSHVDALLDPLHDLKINTVDQLAFLNMCKDHNPEVKIIYTGTRNQYGRAKTKRVIETHPFDPIDTNGVSEIATELYHLLYFKLYGLKSTSIRLCNVFGPRHQMRHSRQGILNWFLRLIIEDKPVPLMGKGKQIRDCVYVMDVVDALLRIGAQDKAYGEAFNIGAYPISLKSFVDASIKVHGKGSIKMIPFPNERKKIEPGDYIADASKLKKYTGWRPQWKLNDALRETLEYYSEHHYQYF